MTLISVFLDDLWASLKIVFSMYFWMAIHNHLHISHQRAKKSTWAFLSRCDFIYVQHEFVRYNFCYWEESDRGIQPLIFINQNIDIVLPILVSVVWHGTSKLFCRPDRHRTFSKNYIRSSSIFIYCAVAQVRKNWVKIQKSFNFFAGARIACPFIRIGSPRPLSRKRVSLPPPLEPKGGGATLACG